mmetsp:Transcript_2192/g.6193  ORF Transcript_2192/g.6193 Transcript_2192/m.6193 type:complete len:260 (-) Transcript_2192:215-994(-)
MISRRVSAIRIPLRIATKRVLFADLLAARNVVAARAPVRLVARLRNRRASEEIATLIGFLHAQAVPPLLAAECVRRADCRAARRIRAATGLPLLEAVSCVQVARRRGHAQVLAHLDVVLDADLVPGDAAAEVIQFTDLLTALELAAAGVVVRHCAETRPLVALRERYVYRRRCRRRRPHAGSPRAARCRRPPRAGALTQALALRPPLRREGLSLARQRGPVGMRPAGSRLSPVGPRLPEPRQRLVRGGGLRGVRLHRAP